ncbi:Ig domain-containing protein [Phenylobacterium sp.]|uniref:Ig domain-containing protein n=1 Tax=Phenylobacterium sp. TaxID=1871053 RepID=UPI0035649DA9
MAIHAGLRGPGHLSAVGGKVSTALALSGTPGPATQNAAYSFAPARTGGTAPFTFSLQAGTLPSGLSLSAATGIVGGTPTGTGTSSGITLRVVDSAATPVTVDLTSLSITVSAALTLTGTAPGATQNSAYSFTPATGGGRGTKTYALTGSLPAGLTFSTSTGTISGTPTTLGATSGLNITVTDADSRTASLGAFSIVVSAASSASTSPGANFMADTIIKAGQLGVTNSTQMTWAFSLKGDMNSGVVTAGSQAGQVLFQSDPASAGEVTAGVAPGVLLAFENTGVAQWNFNNSAGVTPGVDDIKFGFTAPHSGWFTPDAWNTYLLTWDSATGDWALYWGDGSTSDLVDLRAAGVASAASLPTNCLCDLNNANGLMLGGSTWAPSGGAWGMLSDIYIATGECVSDGSGAIGLATRRKFYAGGKAQDLTGFPTGRRPQILLAGGAAGMTSNLGSAAPFGGFAVHTSPFCDFISPHDGFTGQENIRLLDAAWGPGAAEPITPHFRWVAAGQPLGFDDVSTQVLAPDGHRITAGDLLVFAAAMDDRVGTFNHNIALPNLLKTAAGANQPNGWTSVTGGNVYPASDQVAFNVGVKVADAADVRLAESYAQRDTSLVATSSTSVTISGLPNGGAAFNQTFGAGKGFVAGDVVEVYANAPTVNEQRTRFWATVNSYNSGTGVANLTAFAAEGSVTGGAAWTMTLGGWRWSWTMSGSGAGSVLQCGEAFMTCYGGVATVGAMGHANSTAWANPGAIATGGLTTTHANALVMSGFLAADPGPDTTPHSGATYAERWRQMKRSNDSGGGVMFIVADEVKPTAGAYASQSMDVLATDRSGQWNGFVLGFNLELA